MLTIFVINGYQETITENIIYLVAKIVKSSCVWPVELDGGESIVILGGIRVDFEGEADGVE